MNTTGGDEAHKTNPNLDMMRLGVAYTRSLEATGQSARAMRTARRAVMIAALSLLLSLAVTGADIAARLVWGW